MTVLSTQIVCASLVSWLSLEDSIAVLPQKEALLNLFEVLKKFQEARATGAIFLVSRQNERNGNLNVNLAAKGAFRAQFTN